MWGSSEEPPGTMEAGPPEVVANLKETCEQSKNQLESVKDIMLKNKESLKKKEEELQEYAKKLSKFKTRAKKRSNKDDATSSSESTPKSKSDANTSDPFLDMIDDIGKDKTPKAKSALLQKKLAEDRKIFEQRSKELTESKRAAEEKVEALRQQLEEKYVTPVSVVTPVLITSQSAHPLMEISQVQDKDHKITELSNKIFDLEAVIIDLQENLKEKDSVIDSKTKAVTLMSADLSKKGKTTLDTLEDTKDEMRSMQENFVLVEESLRSKNDNLLKQLEEKTSQMSALEESVQSLTEKLEAQKEAEIVSADFSRSTMDTLADTKDAMKAMQENFVLIESSLKTKTEHLLQQLEEREIKLAEAEAKILHLESGLGIERQPNIEDITYKIEKLEKENLSLQDEKYELQKSIAELQNQIVNNEPVNNDGLLNEKDNKITELESQIEELKKSHQAQEEQYKAELQKQIDNLNVRNEEMANKVIELEKHVNEVETEKGDLVAKLTAIENESPKEDERVQTLTKELEELNKSMIKLKAQHKNKLKSMQKQLENFKKVSDTNAELVKLANQVTLLEEEKGNLQLSLVDFDELKASTSDWQERVRDLEGKVSAQAKEIQAHINAIAILENQKLDLMQELHASKQEISSLEAENAESENLRVTAEMKVVDLEEQLESLQKPSSDDPERVELQHQLDSLTLENERLAQKILKLEELKASSEVGSTESFVKTGSNVDSTESFEALAADTERADLLRKIDSLTRENGALLEKLSRFEEKGSSDTGSTESFEKIPEHGEAGSRLDNLQRENYELVVKLTKLEEKLAEGRDASGELLAHLEKENAKLTSELAELQERLALLEAGKPEELKEEEVVKVRETRSLEAQEIPEQAQPAEEVEVSATPVEKIADVEELLAKIESLTAFNENLKSSLQEVEQEKMALAAKLSEKPVEEDAVDKVEVTPVEQKIALEGEKEPVGEKETPEAEEYPNKEKEAVAQGLQEEAPIVPVEVAPVESSALIHDDRPCVADEMPGKAEDEKSSETVTVLESEIARCSAVISEQKDVIEDLRTKLADKEEELDRKSAQLASDSEACDLDVRSLRRELEDSASSIAEWKSKCAETEAKLESLEQSRRQIEEGFHALQHEHTSLLVESERKDALVSSLKEELDSTIASFEARMREQTEAMASQEELVQELRRNVESKDQELQDKYAQLHNDLTKIDALQEEMDKLEAKVQQRDATIASLTEEVETLRTNASVVEEDLFVARHQLTDLHEKLENSKSLEEYNQVAERLHDKKLLVEELEGKVAQRIAEINALKSQTEFLAAENEQLQQRLQEEEHKVADLLEGNRSQEEALRNAERAKAEVENRLLDLQATHEENLRHARSVGTELQDAYKLMEQLKIKHTDDMQMLNRRLEDTLEDLQAKAQEILSLQNEIEQKNSVITASVSEEVKSALESQVAELEKKLSESEEKAQAQLEKMKKYAAVAKKKTAQCEELEARVNELGEKLTLEKSEKETRNRELQDSLAHVREKDNRIAEMEEELQHAQAERDEALRNAEAAKSEFNEIATKLSSLNAELQEMNEVRERARELGVRMGVMEMEYVEQLGQINTLRTENGLLLSKQAQINERLENVEKESEERRAQLEKLEKEQEIEAMRKSEAQEICTQCASRVQVLEAKLQERDAEIENLDNELHNSIGNLVQMQESLRLSTIAAATESTLQESYNELSVQYNALTAASEEMRAKYEAALRDNHELQELNATMQARVEEIERELAKDKETAASFESVHAQYVELLERFERQQSELETSRGELQQALAAGETGQQELQSRIEQLEKDKQNLAQEHDQLRQNRESLAQENEQLKQDKENLAREHDQLKHDRQNLAHEYEQLKNAQQNVVVDDAWGLDSTSSVFDVEALPQQQQEPVNETAVRQRRDLEEAQPVVDMNETPPLFDASVFGEPAAPAVNAELEMEIGRLREEASLLNRQLEEGRLTAESVQVRLNAEIQQARETIESLTGELNARRAELEAVLTTKDTEISALQHEVKATSEALASARAEHDKLSQEMEEKNAWIIGAINEKESSLGQLEQLNSERQEIERIVGNLLFGTPGMDESSSIVQKLHSFEIKHGELLTELDAVKNENQELSAAREVYKNKIIQFEMENKTSGDNAVIAELESRIARVVSERDILQLQVNDVTRAYEDLKESTEGLKNLQSQLEAVSRERNQLTQELAALRASHEQSLEKAQIQKREAAPQPNIEDLSAESMWEDDEDPWGFNDRITGQAEQHVDIPVVPSAEIQLRLKVDELEEKLKELTDENAKLIEDGKLAQVKNVKYVKKLKEYKVQFDSLQRELKSQRSIGDLGDLDSAIEDELKAQIANLEKALGEAREEIKKLAGERENLLKRIEVLTAASERFAEAKEKQDAELHIWQMRYKELEAKLQQLDFGPETRDSTSSPPQQASLELAGPQAEAEIKELKESLDALAAENEELHQLLEENRTKRQASAKESDSQLQELQAHNAELSASADKLKADYDSLRRQYEQSLMDANDQVQSMRQSGELLKAELAEKSAEAEKALAEANEQLHAAQEEKASLESRLQELEQSLASANEEAQKAKSLAESLGVELDEKSKNHEASQAELSGRLETVLDEKAQLETKLQSLESCVGKLNSTSSSLDEVTVLLNTRAQEVASLQAELQRVEAEKAQLEESTRARLQESTDALSESQARLSELSAATAAKDDELAAQKAELDELRGVLEKAKGLELSIEGYVTELQEKNEKIRQLHDKLSGYEAALNEKEQQVTAQQSQIQQSVSEIQQCASQVQDQQELVGRLTEAERRIEELAATVAEKEASLERASQEVDQLRLELQNKQAELEASFERAARETEQLRMELQAKQVELEEVKSRLEALVQEQNSSVQKEIVSVHEAPREEEVPVFTFGSDNDNDQELRKLRAELKAKEEEIEHLHYSLNEAKTTRLMQELQDNVNALYNEKSQLEEELIAKSQEIHGLKTQLEGSNKPQPPQPERRKRSLGEQEELMKLQNELHSRDQQINDLRYMIAEKESQLRASLEQQATAEADQHQYELYEKQQELESLKFTVAELQSEVAGLRGLERLAAEDRATIERLSSEKESVRREAEEAVERMLQDKEHEIDDIRRQLVAENQSLMEALGMRERDLENLKLQIEQTGLERDSAIEQRAEQLSRLEAELSERDRRLAELSITKDEEIYNMRVQLSEKNARVEELLALSEEEERQLAELRKLLEIRDQQTNGLMQQLDEKTKEYELIQHALQRHVPKPELPDEAQQQLQSSGNEAERELDLALYMLHQRDVRCEELALELTQLVDERDTLQLRLSNALRVNEELKKYAADSNQQRNPSSPGPSGHAEPLVDHPSPSKSEGPVEIAREAINSPIGGSEGRKALAQKLSQLRSVDQRRDVRLKDDQEQRHTQQMMLLAHKDVLSRLPPEAAARLVNANYTLSRDVQSQSSVLMNWLWGKSTPKVMHM